MSDTTYNGWTNYATWRINLEIFDNIPLEDFDGMERLNAWREPCPYGLSLAMKERVEYYIECTSQEGMARDYALAFIADVNWYEIAEHKIAEYTEEKAA
jgi:hypothetical protein